MSVTLADRAASYQRRFPQCPDSVIHLAGNGRWLYGHVDEIDADARLVGHMEVGNQYANTSRYYGAFPRTLPERLQALFFEIPPASWLHVFSGSLPKGDYLRLDINAFLEPDIVGDVLNAPRLLAPYRDRIRLVIADPPYSESDAARYNTSMIVVRDVFRALAAAVDPGTHLVWLDEFKQPQYRADEWHRWGSITVLRSGNHRLRELFFFTRV